MDDNPAISKGPDAPPVSEYLLSEYTGGDREFLIELTDQFWTDMEDRLPLLRDCVSPFNGPALKALAHAVAGASSCVGAEGLHDKARALELCGDRADSAGAVQRLAEFEDELQRVSDFFADYLK